MGGRIVYALASGVLLVCWLGLRFERDAFARYATQLPDGPPAIVYEPVSAGSALTEPAERGLAPVVVLAHGFASSERTMSVLARHLARAGYAVIALDFRGHGANTRSFPVTTRGVSSELIEDVASAVLYARMQPGFDGENVALVGHSMGGHAVLAYAGREPGLAAVIGISGGIHLEGPYPPPNVLLLWASGDSRRRQLRLRRVGAELAGLERLVLDRTYGEPERGRAVRSVGASLAAQFRASQVGSIRPGLTIEGGTVAVTDNYLKVRIPEGLPDNQRVRVLITSAGETLTGDVVD